jgi:3-deoxy-D-manno-octulosonic-acid transferase
MREWEVVLSTTTQTGREVAEKNYPGRRVFHFPLDFSWVVEKVFGLIRPTCVLLAEGELWPNFLALAERRGIPVAVVNGRLSEKSLRGYRVMRRLLGGSYPKVRLWCVQNEREAAKVRMLGVAEESLIVTGNLKYDKGFSGKPKDPARRVAELLGGGRVLVAGSTHSGEDEAVLWAFGRLRERFPDLRLVLVPRHPERWTEAAKLIEEAGFKVIRRTALGGVDPGDESDWVFLLDTLGELTSLYTLADVVFVGGSLVPAGGHNVLEPASLGKPSVFGKYMFKSAGLAADMEDGGGGYMVDDREELLERCTELLSSRELAVQVGRNAMAVVEKNRGAAERTLRAVRPLMEAALVKRAGG